MKKSLIISQTALILALTLLLQSLRLFIPIPPLMSTFLIGSLVNTCLIIGAGMLGFWPAVLIAILAPITAYLQQMLQLPIFIIPVALGNIALVLIIIIFKDKLNWFLTIGLGAFCKTILLYSSFSWLLTWVDIPEKIITLIMFAMSWPQFITAFIGGVLATFIIKRLKAI